MKYPPFPKSAYNIAKIFEFLGKNLEFWPKINVNLDIKFPKVNLLSKRAYNTDHVLDYITPESQFFSQNAPIISSMF